MNFYTNVIQWGNNLLVRGVENEKRISKRVRYEPTLFALVNNQQNTEPSTTSMLNHKSFYQSMMRRIG